MLLRFYIMRIPRRGLTFDRITYHAKVTQCLGSLSLDPWYLAVAAPSGSVDRSISSRAVSMPMSPPLSALNPDSCRYPRAEDLQAFKIPHGNIVKLHAGTWHAGPLFQQPDQMDFYNLELKDTNVVDHNIHVYSKDGLQYELEDLQD